MCHTHQDQGRGTNLVAAVVLLLVLVVPVEATGVLPALLAATGAVKLVRHTITIESSPVEAKKLPEDAANSQPRTAPLWPCMVYSKWPSRRSQICVCVVCAPPGG